MNSFARDDSFSMNSDINLKKSELVSEFNFDSINFIDRSIALQYLLKINV